jgi:hypothetical protein
MAWAHEAKSPNKPTGYTIRIIYLRNRYPYLDKHYVCEEYGARNTVFTPLYIESHDSHPRYDIQTLTLYENLKSITYSHVGV